jgi:glycosyltransferase involved in cell wall biosynthesis
MKTGPLVSVLVPVYNGAAFLRDAVASARQQTHQNLEVLVVDDGSTDDSFALASEMAREDSRIKIFRQTNAGTQVARNTALEHAQGDFVALLDQDDVWLPEKLSRQIEVFQQDSRANLVFTNYWHWDGTRDLDLRYACRNKFPEGEVTGRLIRWCLFQASAMMVRHQSIKQVGGFDPDLLVTGDWDLWLRIAETGCWARGIWEPMMRYRLWPGNASKNVIRTTEENVHILEKALTRAQPEWRRRAYAHSLAIARGNLEFARVKPLLDRQPEQAPAAIWRAWRCCPRRIKWLFWYWASGWPAALGGQWTAKLVHDKIRRKW